MNSNLLNQIVEEDTEDVMNGLDKDFKERDGGEGINLISGNNFELLIKNILRVTHSRIIRTIGEVNHRAFREEIKKLLKEPI